jgi:O-methyltransferase domain
MERVTRTAFQGLTNIIRFNWHFYALSLLFIVTGLFFRQWIPVQILLGLILLGSLLSLGVSWYIYDGSGLYQLRWLDELHIAPGQRMVNIHAGFDETSQLLRQKYPEATLLVFDFYDPVKHTEISIERARKAYAPYPGTQTISTTAIPLPAASADVIFLLLAAHEIREEAERRHFFAQLHQLLPAHGKIIVLEHLRDVRNFVAYNVGCLHFFSGANWKRTFAAAQFHMEKEMKITPFLSAFILGKNGTTS